MSMARMKAVDHWLGLPLCALLGLFATLRRAVRRSRRTLASPPRQILVMKFFGLGSVVLASPMLRAIRERYPDTRLTFLTFSGTADLVRSFGLCDEVWRIRTDGALPFLRDVLYQIARFWRSRIDVCIDLEFFSKFSTLLSVLSRAPVRVAFQLNSFWRASLITHPVYYNYYRHVSDVYNEAAVAIGAPVVDPRPCRITVAPAFVDRCRAELRAAGWNGADRLVGVNVNAGELSFERRWPADRFAAVLERLAGIEGLQAVLTGADDEADYVAGVYDRLGDAARARVINMAGRFSFKEFVASMDLYDFFLTNESGPVHIACAQGVATISFWGVGKPSFYGPLGDVHSTFYRQFPCSPCLYMFTSEVGQWCNHRADCMRAIGTDEVWTTVRDYVDRRGEARRGARVAQGW